MKFQTKMFIIFAVIIGLFSFNAGVYAEQIGVVDVNKILLNYNKSKNAKADMKIKEANLQKFIESARKSVQTAKTEVQKKTLENKYNAELKQKVTSINQEQAKKVQEIEINIFNTIKSVAAQKQIQTVFSKESLILGGEDFTNEVIQILNTPPVKQPQ